MANVFGSIVIKRCPGDHVHAWTRGIDAKLSEHYPMSLAKAILKGFLACVREHAASLCPNRDGVFNQDGILYGCGAKPSKNSIPNGDSNPGGTAINALAKRMMILAAWPPGQYKRSGVFPAHAGFRPNNSQNSRVKFLRDAHRIPILQETPKVVRGG